MQSADENASLCARVNIAAHRVPAICRRISLCAALLAACGSAASAADDPFAFRLSSPAPQACVSDRAHAALALDDGFARERLSAETEELRAFYGKAGAELDPYREHASVVTWMELPEEVERVLQEPARLDRVAVAGAGISLAVLRPAHTPATCGSGGCSTPVFVAVGCADRPALVCLSESLPFETHALRADALAFIGHQDRHYLQASSCHCQGADSCYKSVEVYRIDPEWGALELEAKATWHLDTPLMERR